MPKPKDQMNALIKLKIIDPNVEGLNKKYQY